jgi:hypothetical integral membrane protein (TIGR02206 family)
MFEAPKLFTQFGISHILVIISTLLLILIMHQTKNWHYKYRDLLAKVFAILGVVFFPVHFLIYTLVLGTFDIRYDLPILQICGLITASICLYLISKKELFFKIITFWGISAMLASFFTPALLEDFPHIYFWLFWISHWVIVYVISFIILIFPKKINYKDIWIASLALIAYAFVMYIFNIFTDSNYGFVIEKPDSIQFTTIFGLDFNKSPYYLFPALLIAIAIFHCIYALFTYFKIGKSDDLKTESYISVPAKISQARTDFEVRLKNK